MKRKSAIIIAILMMCVGFAAISTTLIINGSAKVSENTDDFSVIFTKATLDGTDVYENVISQDKKTITFETNDLKTLNQTSVLTYEVTNNSANYDAEVTVNCKVKDDAEVKYTSIKNELEGNATVVKAKESVNGTLTVTLNKTSIEEVKEQYVCTLEFNAVERSELGSNVPKPVSFKEDSWSTIAANVKADNTSKYNIGDTKQVDLGDLGTHTVRIANKSACTNGETSETACGFVVEFVNIIAAQTYNNTSTNVGGWRDSAIRNYTNETIYDALPSDLQNAMTTTKAVSGHGSTSGETNFETQDKLYLLNAQEVWGDLEYDSSVGTTKQLDYYKNQGVTADNYAGAIKQYNGSNFVWWLRSAHCNFVNRSLVVTQDGKWGGYESYYPSLGVSPAFRIA